MIDFLDVARRLADKGVVLTVDTDGLKVEAPPGALTQNIRDFLTRHKPDFILVLSGMRGQLLTIARELGLPDRLVLELPESELAATAEQHHDFTTERGEELGRKLLVFYLRSLAGIEPALPGSLAERDACGRRAHIAELRHQRPG